MTLSIKNGRNAFLIRLDLTFSVSLWKEFQFFQSYEKNSNVFYVIMKRIPLPATWFDSYNSLCFKITDKTNSKFDLKIKEALYINWRKPNLNAQQNHLALTLSLQLLSYFVLFGLFFLVSLSSIFIISDTNYWHILPS